MRFGNLRNSALAILGSRRIVIFLLAILAAVITPSGDMIGMMALWAPMVVLYELGRWLAWRAHKKREEPLKSCP